MGFFTDWKQDQEEEYFPSLDEARQSLEGQDYSADLLKHFIMSQHLKEKYGSVSSMAIGLGKELYDMRPGGSGFDLDDLSADLSGNRGLSLQEAMSLGMLTRNK